MKRASSTILILLLLAAVLYLFWENRKLRSGTNTDFFVSEGSTNPKDINLNYLRLRQAKGMVGNYTDFQYKYTTEGMNTYLNRDTSSLKRNQVNATAESKLFYDARLTTFSLDTLKKLVLTMDQLIQEGKVIKPDGSKVTTSELGIKMYYAAYPGLQKGMSYESLSGRHTLVLVPAYFDKKTMAYNDFYPSGAIPKEDPNSLLSKILASRKLVTMGFLPAGDADPEVGVNHTGVCPPPDNMQ